jgi:hypothetical protein
MGRIKKIIIYEHKSNDIMVDIFRGKEWSDFLLVAVDTKDMHEEAYIQLAETLQAAAAQRDKKLIVLPKEMIDSIDIYGVEEDDS